MTAAAIDRVPQGGADESYRTALRIRLDYPGTAVHKLGAHQFHPDHGHVYRASCGAVLLAVKGAMRTTYEASCQQCVGLGGEGGNRG